METFKINIEGIRGQLGYTQEQMAKAIGTTTRTYQNKLEGRSKWLYDEIRVYAELIGVPIDNVDTSPITK